MLISHLFNILMAVTAYIYCAHMAEKTQTDVRQWFIAAILCLMFGAAITAVAIPSPPWAFITWPTRFALAFVILGLIGMGIHRAISAYLKSRYPY